MFKFKRTLRVLTLGAGLAATQVFAADFQLGQTAFDAGDYTSAFREWQPLAEAGDARAQYGLGFMFEYGRGVPRDDAKALGWFLKSAEQGHPGAQYRLGVLYDNGWGVAPEAKMAVFWYNRAAEQGHSFAQHDLAFMHLEGKGVPQDKVQAYKWLRIASALRGEVMAKHLQMVAKTLSIAEREEGEALAQAWFQKR